MQISDVLRHKSSDVITMAATESTRELLATLARHNIGAVVVIEGDTVAGIVSERDIVRKLNDHGADLLDAAVGTIMTEEVLTCAPTDSVDTIAETMTQRRIRHMPVLEQGRLIGIVSIGDVVKSRITQLEIDRGQLENYITQG